MTEDDIDEAAKLPPDARIESLDERLDRAQRREAEEANKNRVDPNMRVTQLVIGYLIGGPLGGGLLGWGLDSLFGTRPWIMLVMLFLGFGVGVRSILRIAKSSLVRKEKFERIDSIFPPNSDLRGCLNRYDRWYNALDQRPPLLIQRFQGRNLLWIDRRFGGKGVLFRCAPGCEL